MKEDNRSDFQYKHLKAPNKQKSRNAQNFCSKIIWRHKDTHGENTPSNKTKVFTKSMNMRI